MSTPASGGARRRGGREARYSTEEVIEAALALVDSEGLHAFSMRRLAERMDIGSMTLYGYVRTREEILDGVMELALKDVIEDFDTSADWETQLSTAVRDLHDALRAHPGALELLLAKPAPSPQLDRVRDALLGILRHAGVDDRAVWELVGILGSYAVGFASSQVSFDHLASATDRLRRLPPEEYPNLVELADLYPSHMSEDAFERGLADLVAGVRARLDA